MSFDKDITTLSWQFKSGLTCSLISLMVASAAAAPAAKQSSWAKPRWHGGYVGLLGGGAFARFNNKTYTEAGSLLSSGQADSINQIGEQNLKPDGFLAGVAGGYNWQNGCFLFGLEADLQSVSVSESVYSEPLEDILDANNQFVLTAYGSANWLMTARPRIGYLSDAGLLYVTGGLALTYLQSDFIFSSANGDLESKRVRKFRPGYVFGAGFETALTKYISMKVEYLLNYFRKAEASAMNQDTPGSQPFTKTVKFNENVLRVGLNYHFADSAGFVSPLLPNLVDMKKWQAEIGVRPFFSTGEDGAPQPLLNTGNVLASRLIFSELEAPTLEVFGRLDHVNGLFVKGWMGAGTVVDGDLNDEDFPAEGAYSNTLSSVRGNISYATADLGYTWIKTPHARSGVFIGYNYNAQNLDAYSCRQLAGAGVCDSGDLVRFLGISEDDHFKSMRIGLISQFDLTNKVSVSAEAAFLPFVRFKGVDYHNARQLIIPEGSSYGNGSMLEAILSYQLTNTWQVGLGGRYWMWNTHDGFADFDFLGSTSSDSREPARYHTYRYGGFLQLVYHEKELGEWSRAANIDWTGFYAGAALGGAWGNSKWPDPFGATAGVGGRTNLAGFGGKVHATGPLAGIDAHYYWQTPRIVYGLGGHFSVIDLRGDDTLFSGLGGVNGEIKSKYLAAIVGKLGVVCDQSLFYANLGPALMHAEYRIDANTGALSLGAQSDTVTRWGAMFGAGIDYAFDEKWSTSVEYDYIYFPGKTLTFPAIATINANSYSVKQSVNLFKVGVNYKFW